MNQQRGFTLLEMMLVLALVAVELPADTDVAATPAASPVSIGAALALAAANADMAKMP